MRRPLPLLTYPGLWLALSLAFPAAAFAQQFGEQVTVAEPFEGDLYGAGRQVAIEATVAGDAVVFGQYVRIGGRIEGDLIAAGESVEVEAPVGDDVRAAGRRVRIDAPVADHVVAAGESVEISSEATLGGFAWLAGADVRVDGQVGGELRIMAEEAVIDAGVEGTVDVTAEDIVIGPEARISGDLIWHSGNEPKVSAGARIDGRILGRPVPPSAGPAFAVGILVTALLIGISVIVTGTVLYLVFPGVASHVAATIRSAPGATLGLGFAVLAAVPFAIALLFVTTVGAMLGLIVLALYLAALPLGWFAGAYCTGEYTLHLAGREEGAGKGSRLLAFLAAMVVLGLVQLVPVLGWLVGIAVLVFGLGGFVLAVARPA